MPDHAWGFLTAWDVMPENARKHRRKSIGTAFQNHISHLDLHTVATNGATFVLRFLQDTTP